MRLQLYKPKKYNKTNKPKKCALYEWWTSGKWAKYPSTLHVNVKKVKSENVQKTLSNEQLNKSELLLKTSEEISQTDESVHINLTKSNVTGNNDNNRKRIWSRISTQSCKIPNKVFCRLKTGSKGCLKLNFSNNGLFLAYSSDNEQNSHIIIYDVRLSNLHWFFFIKLFINFCNEVQ